MINLNYLIIFCIRYLILFWVYHIQTRNSDLKSCNKNVNKKISTFKIKTCYYLELLTAEKMKQLGSTKSKISKDENAENMSHIEITGIVLFHCKIAANDYRHVF